jgi:hypothetical protein
MHAVRIALAFVLFLISALAVACGRPAGAGRIDHLDVHAVLEPDGNLAVTESLTLVSDGEPGLIRVIDSEFADGTVFVSFTVDGNPVEPGEDLSVEPTRDKGLVLRWTPADRTTAGNAIQIQYVLERVAAVRQPRGRLEWAALIGGHDHTVTGARLRLKLPDGAGFHDGTGIGQPGWTVVVDGNDFEATRTGIAAGEAATLLAAFDVDRQVVRQGEWERDLDSREHYFYALISAGAFIAIIGVGILIVLRLQYVPLARIPVDERAKAREDRQALSQGLRTSAIASLGLAGVLTGAAALWLPGLGPAVYAIPGGIAFDAVLLFAAGWRYGRP